MPVPKLKFGKGNGKIEHHTFSLPAGYTCPGAAACLARANRETGEIRDGRGATYRCFAASMEARFPSVRDSRWRNLEALRASDDMAALISASLPRKAETVRIHVSGDYYSRAYLDAWIQVARERPEVIFYGYTKSAHLLPPKSELPANLRIVVSRGTKFGTERACELGYSFAHVVFSPEETNLPIDHDDSHAIAADHDFALLIHGTQRAGSEAAKALQQLKHRGIGGYGKGESA